MKSLYSSTLQIEQDLQYESILDDQDVIIDKATEVTKLPLAGIWFDAHGTTGCAVAARRPQSHAQCFLNHNPETMTWVIEEESITIDKKDKEIPEYVRIDTIKGISIQNYLGKTLPDFSGVHCSVFSIRNCPNLVSLVGCPVELDKFAISGCPKLSNLNGGPQVVKEMYKYLNNGIEVDPATIRRGCKVDKKNIIC